MTTQTFVGDDDELARESMRIEEMDPDPDLIDVDQNENQPVFGQQYETTRSSKKNDPRDGKVENASEVPLFADADKRGLRSISYLKLIKLDMPKAGYKGQIPLGSTLETIGQLYGNGLYKIAACNTKNQVIRDLDNIRISFNNDETPNLENKVQAKSSDTNWLDVFRASKDEKKQDIERVERLARASSEQVIKQGEQFVQLVTTTTQTAAERERTHMMGVQKQQSEFFAAMQQQQTQSFQQMMMMMEKSHSHTLEVMQSARERENNQPMAMVEILMKGLAMGREMDGGDGEPTWIKGLTAGSDMVSNLAKMMIETKRQPVARQLPNPSTPQPVRRKKPVEQKIPVDEKKVSSELTPEELQAAILLKKELHDRGITLVEAVKEITESDSGQDTDDFDDETGEGEQTSPVGVVNRGNPDEKSPL